jgi:lipopolysaccharide transport system ATP-binding protein
MSDVAIRVVGLGKQYHIGGPQKTYDRFGEQIREMMASPFRRALKLLRGQATGAAELDKTIWALKDTSFEIKNGEIIGIIGANGAGKSTLLKILSRITDPTEGYVDIFGRVGSLLEVGTGFHPELTGRENIFLNGAILGMRRTEIEDKFDEIVEFSEIGQFIDTPVKHYSSGMYVRLAFSVAAHLEPEILLVDEVLSVGDAAFQKKCLGKMGDSVRGGRTVLFVSHNLNAVQRLCDRTYWINEGRIKLEGPTSEVVESYLEYSLQNGDGKYRGRERESRIDSLAYYDNIRFLDAEGIESLTFPGSSHFTVEARIKLNRKPAAVQLGLDIITIDGVPVSNVNSRLLGHYPVILENDVTIKWHIDDLRLVPGRYAVNLRMKDVDERELIDYWENALNFQVLPTDFYKTGQINTSSFGVTYLPVKLELNQ